jgi:hypothetical protein
MQVAESELKTFILDSGLVARKDVDAADAKAKSSKQSVGDVLVSEGILSSDALRRIKAYVLGIPFVNLKDSKISFEILSLIPEPIARTHNIIAQWTLFVKLRGLKLCRALRTKILLSTRFFSIRNLSRKNSVI